MGKIYFISTVYSRDLKVEIERSRVLRDWVFDENTVDRMESIGVPKDNFESYFLGRGKRREVGGITKNYDNLVQKGTAIRDKINDMITEEVKHLSDSILIFIDGDGQIPFESIFTVINCLMGKERVVMACRGDRRGISHPRASIENFELFLVSEKYGVSLNDGQCGCWGFHTNLLHKLSFTAIGFDIELNLLSTTLQNKILPAFCYINVEEPTESDYKVGKDDDIKLNFLANRLEWTREFVLKKYQEYIQRYGGISKDYHNMIKTMDWPLISKDTADKLALLDHTSPFKLKPTCYECDDECDIVSLQ